MKHGRHTYLKLLLRGVRSTRARFLSILAIFAVGAGFLGGLAATTPDMQLTANKYYSDTNMFDLYVKGSAGLTQDDLDAIKALDFVKDAGPATVADITLDNSAGSYVTRIYALNLDDTELVNGFVLKEGRLPENESECLICTPNGYSASHSVGEVYTISEDGTADEAVSASLFSFTELTAVGVIELPAYLSIESEPSSVGTGSVQLVMYVPEEICTTDYWTDIYITLDDSADMDSFSDEYADYADECAEELEALGEERCALLSDAGIGAEWYVYTRSDTTSFTSYKSNSEKIAAISRVFPVFLFFVAALVALTTMTRLVEEERVQIGTLKALGYSDAGILGYYLGYSALASASGSVFGVLLGFKTLPAVIANAYAMMFTLPETEMPFRLGYAALIVSVSVLCCLGATLAACLSQLREKPSALMLPRAPKAGKRILLEHIAPLWRRMSFIHKVTARNMFRYKKRFYMTVCGIAGCTALLVCAFGLRDSIHDIVDLQFGEIYKYSFTAYLKQADARETDAALSSALYENENVVGVLPLHAESGHAEFDGESQSVSLVVPEDTEAMGDFINLRERKSGAAIAFEEGSVIATEKLCEKLNAGVGDSVTIKGTDGREAVVTITGVCENYVSAFIFMEKSAYTAAFGSEPEYGTLWGKLSDTSQEARDELSSALLKTGSVLTVSFSKTIRESFENTVQSIDYIVIVLIIAAGVLAVIVLYNLTNINICERKKELATIKVLGFHEWEVAAYIYRESNLLCLIGTALGLALGVWLHRFVVLTSEVDAVMFGRTIYAPSYLYAATVTILFMLLVDLIMLKKLRGIDMVESMKANE